MTGSRKGFMARLYKNTAIGELQAPFLLRSPSRGYQAYIGPVEMIPAAAESSNYQRKTKGKRSRALKAEAPVTLSTPARLLQRGLPRRRTWRRLTWVVWREGLTWTWAFRHWPNSTWIMPKESLVTKPISTRCYIYCKFPAFMGDINVTEITIQRIYGIFGRGRRTLITIGTRRTCWVVYVFVAAAAYERKLLSCKPVRL